MAETQNHSRPTSRSSESFKTQGSDSDTNSRKSSSPPRDTRSIVDPAHELNAKYQEEFARQIGTLERVRTRKVAVLLISWENREGHSLDTRKELHDLKVVFENGFQFEVQTKLLNTEAPRPKAQMISILNEFLALYDDPYTQLIIYYGGHGAMNDDQGRLRLLGGNPKKKDPASTEFFWKDVEWMLYELRADLLLIFDCCYAGFLARDKRKWPESDSLFEFLGSAGSNELARGPRSPGSFTRALIQVLENIAKTTRSFTASSLLHEIVNNPNFRDTQQQPVVSKCGKENSHRELRIGVSNSGFNPESPGREEAGQQNYYFHLMCTFSEEPSRRVMTALTGKLLDLVKHDSLPIKNIEYRGISVHDPKMSMAVAGRALLARLGHRLGQSATRDSEGSTGGDKPANPLERTLTSMTIDKRSLISRSFSRVGSDDWEMYNGKTSSHLSKQDIPTLVPCEVICETVAHKSRWIFISAAVLLTAATATRSIWQWAATRP